MWEKKKWTTKGDKITVTSDVGIAQYEDETVKCKKKNKETIKCDKRIVICDVGIAQCEYEIIKCEKK